MAESTPSQSQHNCNRGRRGGRGWRYGRGGRRCNPRRKDEAHDQPPIDAAKEGLQSMPPTRPGRRGKQDGRRFTTSLRGRNARGDIQNDQASAMHADIGIDGALDELPYRTEYEITLSMQEKPSSQLHGANVSSRLNKSGANSMQKADQAAMAVCKALSTLRLSSFRRTPRTGFLSLPAEIRWQIYKYIFKDRRVELIRAKDRAGRFYRLYSRPRRPRDPKWQAAPTVGAFTMTPPIPLGLIFSCKTVYNETILQLYSTTQFIFNSTRAMTRFMEKTDKEAKASIRHVELNQIGYNEPLLTVFRFYKLRSDFAFSTACEEMALSFTSLKVLHVTYAILDWPIHLIIGETWSQPLLAFACHGGLEFVNVKLYMSMFKLEVREKVARDLEKEMMHPVAYQIREDERLARELAGPVKATKILRLII